MGNENGGLVKEVERVNSEVAYTEWMTEGKHSEKRVREIGERNRLSDRLR
jgi:hypothetical protein